MEYQISIYKKINYRGWFWFVNSSDNEVWAKGYAVTLSGAKRAVKKYIKKYENQEEQIVEYTINTEGKGNERVYHYSTLP